jgi:hypothetical protein
MKQPTSGGAGDSAGEATDAGKRSATKESAASKAPAEGSVATQRGGDKVRSEPADFGGPPPGRPEDQAERQGFDRQRLDPQDRPPADVIDRGNLAGEKDFELGGGKG